MLLTLIRRELLNNLMTFRFAAAVLIMLLLVVPTTAVLIKDHERRLTNYNTTVKVQQQRLWETKTFSAGELFVHRPPSPLSIFNTGLDKRIGQQIEVSHAFVPSLWDATPHSAKNPLINIFTSIDIAFIFEILSLLSLIFAYDALVGDLERGLLRLVLTNPVSRANILISKYISAMIALLVPMLLSLLFTLILLTGSSSISLSSDDFLSIGGFFFPPSRICRYSTLSVCSFLQ